MHKMADRMDESGTPTADGPIGIHEIRKIPVEPLH